MHTQGVPFCFLGVGVGGVVPRGNAWNERGGVVPHVQWEGMRKEGGGRREEEGGGRRRREEEGGGGRREEEGGGRRRREEEGGRKEGGGGGRRKERDEHTGEKEKGMKFDRRFSRREGRGGARVAAGGRPPAIGPPQSQDSLPCAAGHGRGAVGNVQVRFASSSPYCFLKRVIPVLVLSFPRPPGPPPSLPDCPHFPSRVLGVVSSSLVVPPAERPAEGIVSLDLLPLPLADSSADANRANEAMKDGRAILQVRGGGKGGRERGEEEGREREREERRREGD
eukprot:177570-Hanusia_phi.AAC.1